MEENFRDLIKQWSKETFEDAKNRLTDIHDNIESVLNELELLEKNVTGCCVENLKRHEKGERKLPEWCNFSRINHEISTEQTAHPIEFLSEICEKYENYLLKRPEYVDLVPVWGICSRALRTLASFYREVDFRNRIREELLTQKINAVVNPPDPDADSRDHSDAVVVIDEIEYRVWVFQISKQGIFHTSDRVAGNRGSLPEGIHILCGHDREQDDHEETIEGWNFISDSRMKEVVSKIVSIHKGESEAREYSEIKSILDGPRRILSDTTPFNV